MMVMVYHSSICPNSMETGKTTCVLFVAVLRQGLDFFSEKHDNMINGQEGANRVGDSKNISWKKRVRDAISFFAFWIGPICT